MCGWATYVEIPTVVNMFLSILTSIPNFGNFRKLINRLMRTNGSCNIQHSQLSFDEYGRFDVAAQLKSILQLTQQDKLSFVGHSQGSVNFWVAMESNPDLNEKIDVMFALGPVARMGNMTNSIIYAAPYSDHIKVTPIPRQI